MAEGLTLEVALQRYPQLLLDTCVLIDEFNRTTTRLGEIRRPQRATSIIAVWEFLHGARGALLPRDTRTARRDWLREQGIIPLVLSAACSRSFQGLLGTEEAPSSVADAILAAESLARGIPVVTRNVKDFENVRGLRYVPW